ncbi:CTB family bacteriocin [Dolichospermum sp. UHCC 0684]|jgi:hypothetical protein|uniref:CTB family bacteriocin n=1 Tax=unclassified Dolichospermum TaxID=2622029 RepID=UPI0014482F59|nr:MULTISPECIES: CTB family bacteriocin [unclassified Dolichospermum]MEA5529566.1 CTB family bacteriocin [Dolichospermum sp. UHCC 0684]MTJ35628.1 hypothetical protein [Dolichospermum sp. UHCC 0260]
MSNLFTAVSVEQQEIVTGGVVVAPDTTFSELLNFNQNTTLFNSQSSAGPGGVVSLIGYGNNNVASTLDKRASQIYFSY